MKNFRPELIGLPANDVQGHCPACGNIGPDSCQCKMETIVKAIHTRRDRVPLFDAAPKLLAACLAAREVLIRINDQSKAGSHLLGTINQLRDAIADAEGK